jgi:hypothetical protein
MRIQTILNRVETFKSFVYGAARLEEFHRYRRCERRARTPSGPTTPRSGPGASGLMSTDTAEFRNPSYHQPTDTPETLDHAFMGEVAKLLAHVVRSSRHDPGTWNGPSLVAAE